MVGQDMHGENHTTLEERSDMERSGQEARVPPTADSSHLIPTTSETGNERHSIQSTESFSLLASGRQEQTFGHWLQIAITSSPPSFVCSSASSLETRTLQSFGTTASTSVQTSFPFPFLGLQTSTVQLSGASPITFSSTYLRFSTADLETQPLLSSGTSPVASLQTFALSSPMGLETQTLYSTGASPMTFSSTYPLLYLWILKPRYCSLRLCSLLHLCVLKPQHCSTASV